MRAITLLSGGLDSVVATAAAAQQHKLILALTVDYGQRSAQAEIRAARQVARALSIEHTTIPLSWLGEITTTALVAGGEQVPELAIEDLDNPAMAHQLADAVWVPNRNGLFLNIAAAYCESLDCRGIVCGFNAEESVSFPDNSRQFIQAAEAGFAYSTRRRLKVIAPTLDLTKSEIVQLGYDLAAPLDLIWSCYRGGEKHCWHCPSCLRVQRALKQAGRWEQWQDARTRLSNN